MRVVPKEKRIRVNDDNDVDINNADVRQSLADAYVILLRKGIRECSAEQTQEVSQ